ANPQAGNGDNRPFRRPVAAEPGPPIRVENRPESSIILGSSAPFSRQDCTMFDGIQRGLKDAIKKLRGRGRITEENVAEGLLLVRTALLEADVNYTVANEFIERVKVKAVGQEVLRTLDP